MTGPEIMTAVLFGITIIGFISGAWWRWMSVVKTARSEALAAALVASTKADVVSADLNDHRLHVAETYLTKAGLREQMEPLFDAVKDVGGQVQKVNDRLDRVIESTHVPAARSRAKPIG